MRYLTHWGQDKIVTILQTTFSNAFSRTKMKEFRFRFQWSLFDKNIPSLVQIMTWRRPGDKALSEPMMCKLLKPICVTQPQWVKRFTMRKQDFWISCPHAIFEKIIKPDYPYKIYTHLTRPTVNIAVNKIDIGVRNHFLYARVTIPSQLCHHQQRCTINCNVITRA